MDINEVGNEQNMDTNSKENRLISMGEFVEIAKRHNLIIPLIQRNYKWPAEEGAISAKKLIDDIISACKKGKKQLTLGILTLKIDSKGDTYILDGQQRLITLTIIMKILGKLNDTDWLEFTFERDANCTNKRVDYLFSNGTVNSESVDICRMQQNEESIRKSIDEAIGNSSVTKESIYNFIMENIRIVYRNTKGEMLDEFLNMNANKTPFQLCDYAKYYLLINATNSAETQKLLVLWKEISEILYRPENQEIFDIICSNYELSANVAKVRMNILFADRYQLSNKEDMLDDDNFFVKEIQRLRYYRDLLRLVTLEKEKIGKSILNLFQVLTELQVLTEQGNPITFFGGIEDDDIDKGRPYLAILTEIYNEHITEHTIFSYMNEATLGNRNKAISGNQEEGKILKEEDCIEGNVDPRFAKYLQARMEEASGIFETMKSAEISCESAGTGTKTLGKTAVTSATNNESCLENLLDRFDKVVIPDIQRDYMLGGEGTYMHKYLLAISKVFIDAYEADIQREFGEMNHGGELGLTVVPKMDGDYEFAKKSDDKNAINLYGLLIGVEEFEDTSGGIHYISIFKRFNTSDFGFQSSLKSLYAGASDIRGFIKRSKTLGNYANRSNAQDIYPVVFPITEKVLPSSDYNLTLALEKFAYGEYAYFYVDKGIQYTDTSKCFRLSCIMGAIKDGAFFVYDGQQRLSTSVILCAYLIKLELHTCSTCSANIGEDRKTKLEKYRTLLRKFEFKNRESANECLAYLLSDDDLGDKTKWVGTLKEKIVDHTTHSIYSLIRYLLQAIDLSDKCMFGLPFFCNVDFIMKQMRFETVVVDQIDDAEQLFIDMNEGVALEEYEIYKAKSNHIIGNITKNTNWANSADNQWVNAFYKRENVATSLEDSEKKLKNAEINEIKYMKACLYMAYNEHCKDGIALSDDEILEKLKTESKASDIIKRAKYILDVTAEVLMKGTSGDTDFDNAVKAFIDAVVKENNGNRIGQIRCWNFYATWLRCIHAETEINIVPYFKPIVELNQFKYTKSLEYLVEAKKRYLTTSQYIEFCNLYYSNFQSDTMDIHYYAPILHNSLNFCESGYLTKFADENTEEITPEKIYNKLLERRFRLKELEVIQEYEAIEEFKKYDFDFDVNALQLNGYIMPNKYRLMKKQLANEVKNPLLLNIDIDNYRTTNCATFLQEYEFELEQIRYIWNCKKGEIQCNWEGLPEMVFAHEIYKTYSFLREMTEGKKIQENEARYDPLWMRCEILPDNTQIQFYDKRYPQPPFLYQATLNHARLSDYGISIERFRDCIAWLNDERRQQDDFSFLNGNAYTTWEEHRGKQLNGVFFFEAICNSKNPTTQKNLELVQIEKILDVPEGTQPTYEHWLLAGLNNAIVEWGNGVQNAFITWKQMVENQIAQNTNVYEKLEEVLIKKYIYLQEEFDITKNRIALGSFENALLDYFFCRDTDVYYKYFFTKNDGGRTESSIPYLCMEILHYIGPELRKAYFDFYLQNKANIYLKETEALFLRCFQESDYYNESRQCIYPAELQKYMNLFGVN